MLAISHSLTSSSPSNFLTSSAKSFCANLAPCSRLKRLRLLPANAATSKSPSSTSLLPGTFSSPSSASPVSCLLLIKNNFLSLVFCMLPGVGPSTELEACIKEFTADGAIEISREWRVCRPHRGTLLGRSARRGEASPPPVVGESQSNARRSCHHRSFRFGSQDTWLVPRREA